MQNILLMSLNLLLTAVIAAVPFRISQAVSCYDDQQTHAVTGLKRLEYGSPVDLTYKDGQSLIISSDSGGKALEGKVALETSSGAILYFQDAAAAPDISASLAQGSNTVTLMGDEGRHFWLITQSPCPALAVEAKEPEGRAVIAPALANESFPATTVEPAPVVTPAPIPMNDGIGAMQRMLVFMLTLLVIFVRIVQISWIIGAVLLAVAGLVFAYRRRDALWDWITGQVRTIRKEVWHS